MLLFKTSGETFDSVIRNQKHAFVGEPRSWSPGELVLVSKNKKSLAPREKQIQYSMRLMNVRRLIPGEAGTFWPGNEGRWNYLMECADTIELREPFNLDEVLGNESEIYRPVVTFKRILPQHESKIERLING